MLFCKEKNENYAEVLAKKAR